MRVEKKLNGFKQQAKNFQTILKQCTKHVHRLFYCSDFRYESNGIFVLGVGFFFFRQISTFYLAIFDGIFFISFERYCCPELKFDISPVIIFRKVMGV